MRDANKINRLDLLLAKISIEEKSVGPRADRRSADSRNSPMLPLFSDSQTFVSILGLVLLVIGLYLISKGIGDKPDIDPYAVQSYDEEE